MDRSLCELREEEPREFWNMLWVWSNYNDPDLEAPERLQPYADDLLGEDHLEVDTRDYDQRERKTDGDDDQVKRKI